MSTRVPKVLPEVVQLMTVEQRAEAFVLLANGSVTGVQGIIENLGQLQKVCPDIDLRHRPALECIPALAAIEAAKLVAYTSNVIAGTEETVMQKD